MKTVCAGRFFVMSLRRATAGISHPVLMPRGRLRRPPGDCRALPRRRSNIIAGNTTSGARGRPEAIVYNKSIVQPMRPTDRLECSAGSCCVSQRHRRERDGRTAVPP
jgi:hypothetical protein